MTRFLVTGASGLLGLNFSLQAAEKHQVTGVFHNHGLKDIPFSILRADLCQPGEIGRVLDQAAPEVILHCAALANLDTCEGNNELAYQVNAHLPGDLAREARKRGIRLVHISTDAVFDGQRGDYQETDAPNPVNTYARTKLAGEQAVMEANPDALIARVVFYGWSLKGARSLGEWFVNNLSAGKQIYGFTDVFFCPLQVNLLAETLEKMVAMKLSGLYHVVSSEPLSKDAFGRHIARQFGLDESLITPVSWKSAGLKAVRSPNLTLGSDKLARVLGGKLPGQESGVRRFHAQYLANYPMRLRSFGVADTEKGAVDGH